MQDNDFEKAMEIIGQGHLVVCPSLGEYPAYDDLVYEVMGTAPEKIEAYENAVKNKVKDKVIVEIGTGARAVLALTCANAGARKVYAIEGDPVAAQKAERLVAESGMADIIQIIPGYSHQVSLPEKADLCVSEIIGNIASSEGAVSILNDSRSMLKDRGHFIPESALTRIVPVFMPHDRFEDEFTRKILDGYIQRVYQSIGFEFEFTRFAVFNFSESSWIADPGVFEAIDFNNNPLTGSETRLMFSIRRDAQFTGFLLWVELAVNKDNVINTLTGVSWAPVYIEAGDVSLKKGDVIHLDCSRQLSWNQVNPDYFFSGSIHRDGELINQFKINSWYAHRDDKG